MAASAPSDSERFHPHRHRESHRRSAKPLLVLSGRTYGDNDGNCPSGPCVGFSAWLASSLPEAGRDQSRNHVVRDMSLLKSESGMKAATDTLKTKAREVWPTTTSAGPGELAFSTDQRPDGARPSVPMRDVVYQVLASRPQPHIGHVWRDRSIRKVFDHTVAVAQLDDFRFHDLRHTFASNFVMRGGSLQSLKEILSHGSMAMTLRYAHLAAEHVRREMERTARAHEAGLVGGNNLAGPLTLTNRSRRERFLHERPMRMGNNTWPVIGCIRPVNQHLASIRTSP
jgi:hypothetical protein